MEMSGRHTGTAIHGVVHPRNADRTTFSSLLDPVSLLPAIAVALAVSVETLIGQKEAAPGKRGPAPKLQQQMERIQRLPRAKQRFVMDMIDTVACSAGSLRLPALKRGLYRIYSRSSRKILVATTDWLGSQPRGPISTRAQSMAFRA